MEDQAHKTPQGVGPRAGTMYLFTFPFPIIVSSETPLEVHEVKVGDLLVRAYPMFRSAPANYTLLPEIKPSAIPFLPHIKPDIDPAYMLPRSAISPTLGLTEDGQVRLLYTRSQQFEGEVKQLPMDSLRLDVVNVSNSGGRMERFSQGRSLAEAKQFTASLLQWIRFLTGQWWISRTWGALNGYCVNFIAIDSGGYPLGDFGMAGQDFVAPSGTEVPLTKEIWRDALNRATHLDEPPLEQVLLADAKYYRSDGDLKRAILEAATACEIARDKAFRRIGKKVPDRNLVEHISGVLLRNGRPSYEKVEPRNYLHVQELWLGRGNIAHGKAAYYYDKKAQQNKDIDSSKVGEWIEAATHCVHWLDQLT